MPKISPDDVSILTLRAMYPNRDEVLEYLRHSSSDVQKIADLIKQMSTRDSSVAFAKPKGVKANIWLTAKEIVKAAGDRRSASEGRRKDIRMAAATQ
jgi:hypothetical protein